MSSGSVTAAQRKLAKTFLQKKLDDKDKVDRVENEVYSKHAASIRAYRSCVRETAMRLSR